MNVMNKNTRKVTSFIVTLAMIIAMFAMAPLVAPLTVYADTWDGFSSDITWDGAGTEGNPYKISSAAELRGLAVQVTSGTGISYAGIFFALTTDINLNNHPWTPIGGGQGTSDAGDYSLPNPGNKPFAGTFNGRYGGESHVISNLKIDNSTAGSGCTGLFGYSTGGIMNLTVSGGSINITSGAVHAVGGIVGYLTGSIRNCHNKNVSVSAINSGSRYVGGIAGEMVNTSSSPNQYSSIIDYCSNSGDITAPGRAGGIVGEIARTSADSQVIVDQCFNTGKVTNNVTDGKVWTGGIVGYCMGTVSNCYNRGDLDSGANRARYLGGISGILYGYGGVGIYGKMDNCYNYAKFHPDNCLPSEDMQLYSSADSNPNVVITASFWAQYPTGASITQPTDSTWGTCHYVTVASIQQLSGQTDLTAYYTYGQPATATTGSIFFFLNRQFDGSETGGKYTEDTENINEGFPVLGWQNNHTFFATVVGTGSASGTPVNTNTSPAIYLNGVSGDDINDGLSEATAVKTFAKANSLLSGSIKTIYITGTVTVDTTTSWALSVTDASIVRSYNYGGTLISVSGGALTLGAFTLDGNHDNIVGPAGRMIDVVNGGSLAIGTNTLLRKNYSDSNGGAVRILYGTFTMNGGTISDCISRNEGGGVAVYGETSTSPGIFTMNGGTIMGNSTSQQGGGVMVGGDAEFEMTGGTISGNAVDSGLGDGVYVEGTFTVTQGGSSTVSAGTIYLPTGKTISLGAALSGSSMLTVLCEDDYAGREVAVGATAGDEYYFAYDGYSYGFDIAGSSIVLAEMK